jgi:hypothetical protein
MTRLVTTWRAAALGLVAVLAVTNLIHAARKVPPPSRGPAGATDIVTTQERRFAALRRSVLERGLSGTIGYVGDVPRERLIADPQAVQEYYLAQYVLVPLVLDVDSSSHEWAVGNFQSASARESSTAGWNVEQDFGGGVLLLKKVRP